MCTSTALTVSSCNAVLVQVVSIGQGREGESGTLIENAGLNPGDLVYVKDPWGELRLLLLQLPVKLAFCSASRSTHKRVRSALCYVWFECMRC
jgi:hypothetical protein